MASEAITVAGERPFVRAFAARYRCPAAAYPMCIPCYNSLCGLRVTIKSFSLSLESDILASVREKEPGPGRKERGYPS